jgi:hypothetical protein
MSAQIRPRAPTWASAGATMGICSPPSNLLPGGPALHEQCSRGLLHSEHAATPQRSAADQADRRLGRHCQCVSLSSWCKKRKRGAVTTRPRARCPHVSSYQCGRPHSARRQNDPVSSIGHAMHPAPRPQKKGRSGRSWRDLLSSLCGVCCWLNRSHRSSARSLKCPLQKPRDLCSKTAALTLGELFGPHMQGIIEVEGDGGHI